MAKEFAGQPWWVWAAGGTALVGGYLWIRHSQNKAAAAAPAAGGQTPVFVGQGTGIDNAALLTWLGQHQGQPHATPVCPKGFAYDADSRKCIPEGHKEGGGGKGKG